MVCQCSVTVDIRDRSGCLPGKAPWDHTLTHTQGVAPTCPCPLAEWGLLTTVDSAGVTLMAKEEETTCYRHVSSMPQMEEPGTLTSRDRTLLGSSSSSVKMSPRFTVS